MSVDINRKPLRKYDCELEASQSGVIFIPLFPFCPITLTAKIPPNPAYPKKLKTIGHHLRKRRLDLKLKQEDVARRIGVDVVSIHKWRPINARLRFATSLGLSTFLDIIPMRSPVTQLAGSWLLAIT